MDACSPGTAISASLVLLRSVGCSQAAMTDDDLDEKQLLEQLHTQVDSKDFSSCSSTQDNTSSGDGVVSSLQTAADDTVKVSTNYCQTNFSGVGSRRGRQQRYRGGTNVKVVELVPLPPQTPSYITERASGSLVSCHRSCHTGHQAREYQPLGR